MQTPFEETVSMGDLEVGDGWPRQWWRLSQRNSSIKHEFIMFIVIALLENTSPLSNGTMPSNALNSISLHWAFQMLLQHPYPQPRERVRSGRHAVKQHPSF
jgi:hypothetical protein